MGTALKSGFVKASSENLPVVDLEMLVSYIAANPAFVGAEMRGVKTSR